MALGMSKWVRIFAVATLALSAFLREGETARVKRAASSALFSDLTVEEMNSVIEYLERSEDIKLKPYEHEHAHLTDPFVFLIEAIRPKKAEALRHLDSSGPLPQRAARVVVHRGDLTQPVIHEYRVSPIPNPTSHQLIKNPKWKDPIPFNARSPVTYPDVNGLLPLLERELTRINGILMETTQGFSYGNCTDKCLLWLPGIPPYADPGNHKVTVYLVKGVEGAYLHPIGLQFVVNMNMLEPSEWFVELLWFQGQQFKNFDQLIEAKKTGRLTVHNIPVPNDMFGPKLMSSLNFRGEPRPSQPLRGPRSHMPDGKRFTVSDRRIQWMGWDFEFGMLSSSGIQLFNVKFLKERIAYELSLQEVAIFYSGGSPVPSHTTYYDSVTVIGLQTAQMFEGIDCPRHAQFFDFVHYLNGKPHVFPRGACVFEHDRGIPLRRHTESDHEGGYFFAQGMPDNVLIFRHVLTVVNYDYIIDFMFHQGGQIEGKVSLSGYLLNTFYTGPEIDKYGNVVNEPRSIANMHHHIVNLKADLDIKGSSNRFETLDIKLEKIKDSINEGKELLNRYFVHDLKVNERSAAYKYNFSTPKYLVMFNEKSKNKFGRSRGYRILSEGMSKVLLPSDYRGFGPRSWAEYQVAVTKYHDDELCSSSIYNTMEPYDPVVSFESYLQDDENIVDQDLVAWITMGTHHIPHSEDVPIVTSPSSQMTFFLLPYNYFDEDPALASRDNIRVLPGKEGPVYEYSGVPEDAPEKGDVAGKCATNSCSILIGQPSVVLLSLVILVRHFFISF